MISVLSIIKLLGVSFFFFLTARDKQETSNAVEDFVFQRFNPFLHELVRLLQAPVRCAQRSAVGHNKSNVTVVKEPSSPTNVSSRPIHRIRVVFMIISCTDCSQPGGKVYDVTLVLSLVLGTVQLY
jgi:hypothetical protein